MTMATSPIGCHFPNAERRINMAKCTGIRCPMQDGYKVDECNHKDCPYRTEPITNADRIRAMNDEELEEFLIGLTDDGNLRIREWLKQPAE